MNINYINIILYKFICIVIILNVAHDLHNDIVYQKVKFTCNNIMLQYAVALKLFDVYVYVSSYLISFILRFLTVSDVYKNQITRLQT